MTFIPFVEIKNDEIDDLDLEREIYEKLLEAEHEAETTTRRYPHEEVMAEMQAKIDAWQNKKIQDCVFAASA